MWQSFVVDDQKRYFAQRELRHPDYKFTLFDSQSSICYIEILHKTNAVERAEALNRHITIVQPLDANHMNETLLRATHDAATEYRLADQKIKPMAEENDSNGVKILIQMVYKQKDGKYFRYFWQLRQATQEEFCEALFKPALQSISEINTQIRELRGALMEREKKPWQRSFDFRSFDTKYEESTSRATSLMRLGTTIAPTPIRSGRLLPSKNAKDELRILKMSLSPLRRQMAMRQTEALPPVVLENNAIKVSLADSYVCNCDYCRKQQQLERRAQREQRKQREPRVQREPRESREPRERRERREQREPRGQRGYNSGNQKNAKKQQKSQEVPSVDTNTFRILHKNPNFKGPTDSSSSSAPEVEQSRRKPRR
ncbi:uncharacterized protein [Drosophila tropicalis]|uniref:uncharacterized protein n=1 Tax=Drosophila tropicalis TaxID=46794 RepID=UPI0035ABC43C